MREFLSMAGKALLWIVIIALAFVGPIMWFLVDIELWEMILNAFGL